MTPGGNSLPRSTGMVEEVFGGNLAVRDGEEADLLHRAAATARLVGDVEAKMIVNRGRCV